MSVWAWAVCLKKKCVGRVLRVNFLFPFSTIFAKVSPQALIDRGYHITADADESINPSFPIPYDRSE